MARFLSALLLLFALQHSAFANEEGAVFALPKITKPVTCTINKDCWIASYVDMDPNETAQDYTCGAKTSNTHAGTDFALKDMAQMQKGIDVIAVLAGTIVKARDNLTDTIKQDADLNTLETENKACGNGVLIDHAIAGYPGLRSVYCHLKQGSLNIKDGDVVAKGDVIAQIGHSGVTKFPHLHFSLVWEGASLDPFLGRTVRPDKVLCKDDVKINPMWETEMNYQPVSIFNSGFRTAIPNFEDIINGDENPETFEQGSNALVYWAGFYGLNIGDIIEITITNPRGRILAKTTKEFKNWQPRQYYFTGKKQSRFLARGEYKSEIKITRDEKIIATHQEFVTLR